MSDCRGKEEENPRAQDKGNLLARNENKSNILKTGGIEHHETDASKMRCHRRFRNNSIKILKSRILSTLAIAMLLLYLSSLFHSRPLAVARCRRHQAAYLTNQLRRARTYTPAFSTIHTPDSFPLLLHAIPYPLDLQAANSKYVRYVRIVGVVHSQLPVTTLINHPPIIHHICYSKTSHLISPDRKRGFYPAGFWYLSASDTERGCFGERKKTEGKESRQVAYTAVVCGICIFFGAVSV